MGVGVVVGVGVNVCGGVIVIVILGKTIVGSLSNISNLGRGAIVGLILGRGSSLRNSTN